MLYFTYHRLLGGVRPGQRVLVDDLELPLEVRAELALHLVVEDHVAEEDGETLQRVGHSVLILIDS